MPPARKKVTRTSREDILPGSLTNGRCTVCGNVFSTVSNFDKHRKGSFQGERYCVEPSEVGLRLSDKGLWITDNEWYNE